MVKRNSVYKHLAQADGIYHKDFFGINVNAGGYMSLIPYVAVICMSIFLDWIEIVLSEVITLKRNKDFHRLYSRGRSFASGILVIYVMKNRTQNVRIGITTSKKIGKAVLRNRSRRIIRAAYYQIMDDIKPGYDMVFVARGKTPFVKSTDILCAMKKELKKAGVLK